jgi:hypothetical protein
VAWPRWAALQAAFIEIPIAVDRRHLILLVVSLVAAATAVLFFFNPRTTWFYPQCPFFALTGFECPGCGTTRALHALLHGHLATAFALNPLLFIVPPLFGLFQWTPQTDRRALGALRWRNVVGWTLLALIVAFWIARNLPNYPLTALGT